MHYITKLIEDTQKATNAENVKWIDSSYCNDACPSIMYELTDDGENYVQLFAFETVQDARLENFKQYGITICKNGNHFYGDYETDCRKSAIDKVVSLAETMAKTGFECDGIYILDISRSLCGREKLTTQQAIDTYAPTINRLAKSQSFADLDSLCLFVQNCIGITDGGNASIFWSGYDDGIQELLDDSGANNVLDVLPDDYFLEYICSEIANHLGFDDGFDVCFADDDLCRNGKPIADCNCC